MRMILYHGPDGEEITPFDTFESGIKVTEIIGSDYKIRKSERNKILNLQRKIINSEGDSQILEKEINKLFKDRYNNFIEDYNAKLNPNELYWRWKYVVSDMCVNGLAKRVFSSHKAMSGVLSVYDVTLCYKTSTSYKEWKEYKHKIYTLDVSIFGKEDKLQIAGNRIIEYAKTMGLKLLP